MGKNNSSVINDERDLERFEAYLKMLAKAGEIPFPISEKEIEDLKNEYKDIALPPELTHRFMNSIKTAYEDIAIKKAKKSLHGEMKVFGKYIKYLRMEAGISVYRIAERLRKDKDFVEKLELGQLSPLHLAKEGVADLMEVFRIDLRELITSVKMFLKVSQKAESAPVHARADKKRNEKERLEDLSIAMEDLIYEASKKKSKEVLIPEEFLTGIREELERRGRNDLIK